MKTRKFVSTVCLMMMTGLMSGAALAQADDLPDGVTVRGFAYAGSGCPAGTVTGDFPVLGREFLLVWESMNAEFGPGIPLREARKNCQVNLDLDYPAGWQYTVESVEYNGHVSIESGLQAIAGSAYYFQGSAETVRFYTLFEGPEDRDYHVRDTAGDQDQVWSECEPVRSLNVNFQVRLSNTGDGTPSGRATFGGVDDGVAGTLLTLKWRRCAG